jgi:hypothetical protein
MLDELNINNVIINQILHGDLGKRKMCAKFIPHRLMVEQKKWTLAPCKDFIQTSQENPSLPYCIFVFPKVKLPSKKGFRMVKTLRKFDS